MTKTTVYLDETLKADLEHASEVSGRSQADLIRDGIEQVVHQFLHKRPSLQPAVSGPSVLDRYDELMTGFGS